MIDRSEIPAYRKVQNAAKVALAEIGSLVTPGMSESYITELSVAALERQGVTETWYYAVPAYVLVGSRSILSMSGRDYIPSVDTFIEDGDVYTVDLSPLVDHRWGDCARTFHVGRGEPPHAIAHGVEIERRLHLELARWATPDATFDALYRHMNARIVEFGYENLDFAGNLGHTIELTRDERIYIEAGNLTRLGDVSLFTFEPHIRRPESSIGVKHENIYFFDSAGRLTEL